VVGLRSHELYCMQYLSAMLGIFRGYALTDARVSIYGQWQGRQSFSGTLHANPPRRNSYRTQITLPLINLSIHFAKSETKVRNAYCV
jgi:hypothetical protein